MLRHFYRFYSAPISKICKEVLDKHLEGKEYDEDASKDQVVTICEEIKGRAKGIFRHSSMH